MDTFEGSVPEENLLHSLLEKYKVKNEWMKYDEEILLLWKLYKEIRPKVRESIIQYEHYIEKDYYNEQIEYYKNKIEEYKEILSKYKTIEDRIKLLEQKLSI